MAEEDDSTKKNSAARKDGQANKKLQDGIVSQPKLPNFEDPSVELPPTAENKEEVMASEGDSMKKDSAALKEDLDKAQELSKNKEDGNDDAIIEDGQAHEELQDGKVYSAELSKSEDPSVELPPTAEDKEEVMASEGDSMKKDSAALKEDLDKAQELSKNKEDGNDDAIIEDGQAHEELQDGKVSSAKLSKSQDPSVELPPTAEDKEEVMASEGDSMEQDSAALKEDLDKAHELSKNKEDGNDDAIIEDGQAHEELQDGKVSPAELSKSEDPSVELPLAATEKEKVFCSLRSIPCLPFEFTRGVYGKLRKDKHNFQGDKEFCPLEPQDPLGYYNGFITMLTQALFREVEFQSRNSPKFINGCNKFATLTHQVIAKSALVVIAEPSSYSKPMTFTGVGGIYAISRVVIPIGFALGLKYHSARAEAKKDEAKKKNEKVIFEDVKRQHHAFMKSHEEVKKKVEKMGKEMSITNFRIAVMETLRGGRRPSLDMENSKMICKKFLSLNYD